jgi:LAS superfamily LD-carboxypeptidase LdcB
MNKTQTNIDKVQKPAAATAAKATAAKAPAATTAPAAKPVAPTNKKKRKKIRFKPNKGGMLALLALVLITAVIVTAVVFIAKGIIHAVNNPKETTESTSGNTDKPTIPWNNAYVTEPYANSNIPVGSLILVNFNNQYPLADTLNNKTLTNLYNTEGYSSHYVLPGAETFVHNSIVSPLKQLIFAMVDANAATLGSEVTDRLYITGAYRDTTLQTTLNTNNPTAYPEAPGFTEHHTGLAVDFKIMSNGATVSLRDAEYEWLEANCTQYGFVFRYDANKSALTGIANEPYHLRYVGIPHATYMSERGLCLEEYLELLRTSHTYDKTPLEITAGDQEYLVYYVAADTAEGANFSSIPVPPASEGTYTISGDNMNGFIVTVTKAK